jgi:hypothetical protein
MVLSRLNVECNILKHMTLLQNKGCNKLIHFIVAMYHFVIIFRVTEVSSIVAELCAKAK